MKQLFDTLTYLPMNAILRDIIDHVNDGGVALVASETGSGKSLLTPAAIYDDCGEQILICEPSRFLSMNAATTICEITGTNLGDLAGYSVGLRGRETFITKRKDTPLVFETYGMSLASQSILTAENIVLDEAHDPQMDITIASAIVKQRLSSPDNTIRRLVIMSATMDVAEKMIYWKDFNPKVFELESGLRYKCDVRWEPATPVAEAVMKLINVGKKGILVFCPGVAEIQRTVDDLEGLVNGWLETHPDMGIDILQLHSGSEYEDRVETNRPLEDNTIRVLIGTNVMESGVNFPWVDAGVGSGLCKENHVARGSGAIELHTTPITRSSLQQQTGRTNRFCDSVFILCGHTGPDAMSASPKPEILRVPLTNLHMHCASLGVDPQDLDFQPSPNPEKFKEASNTLLQLGFLDAEHNLTEAGEFSLTVPVGPETAALLWHAKCLDILPEALRLAAVYEADGVRKDTRFPHNLDTTSDHLDGMVAYAIGETIQDAKDLSHETRVTEMLTENIGKKRFDAVKDVVAALKKVFNIKDLPEPEILIPAEQVGDVRGLIAKLRQCLLAASLDHLGQTNGGIYTPAGSRFSTNSHGTSSGVFSGYTTSVASACLRMITPRDPTKRSFTIAEKLSLFELGDLAEFDKIRPGVFTFEQQSKSVVKISVFGKEVCVISDPTGILCDVDFVEPPQIATRSLTLGDIFRQALSDRPKSTLLRNPPVSISENVNRPASTTPSKLITLTPKPTPRAEVDLAKLAALKERFRNGKY